MDRQRCGAAASDARRVRESHDVILPLLIGYGAWFIFVVCWNVLDRRAAKTVATPDAGRQRLYLLVITVGMVMIWVAPVTMRGGTLWVNPTVSWAMLSVIATGMAWNVWARRHLGSLWSDTVTRKEGHRIVDTGPYRFVRHPMYSGFIVCDIGLAGLSATPMGLAAVAVITLGLWLKARVEEEFLAEELGVEAYAGYKARTPMLVPRMQRRLQS